LSEKNFKQFPPFQICAFTGAKLKHRSQAAQQLPASKNFEPHCGCFGVFLCEKKFQTIPSFSNLRFHWCQIRHPSPQRQQQGLHSEANHPFPGGAHTLHLPFLDTKSASLANFGCRPVSGVQKDDLCQLRWIAAMWVLKPQTDNFRGLVREVMLSYRSGS